MKCTFAFVCAIVILTSRLAIPPQATATEPQDPNAIRPFKFHASQKDLDDLKRRILATRWPEKETVADDRPAPAGIFRVSHARG